MMFRPLHLPESGDYYRSRQDEPQFAPNRDSIGDDALHGDSAPEPVDGAPHAEALLVRAFIQEIHTAALLTAGAASAFNFAARAVGPAAIAEASTLVSDFAAETSHWPHRLLVEEISPELVRRFAEFYAAFRMGRTHLREFEIDASGIGPQRATPLHIVRLTATWNAAARRARELVEHLDSHAGSSLPAEFSGNADLLVNLLNRTIDGEPACCCANGTIVLPQLAERRRAPRQSLLQTAQIRTKTGAFQAFARDISSGGIGLTRMPPLKAGDMVDIELACGRSLRGIVAWSRGEDVGIRFDRQLSPTDPLIFG